MKKNKKPNLLFIFTDEQAANTMAAYGNELIKTPNLNRLAEKSTVFKNAYVTQPVCTPSRSTLLTGLYPHSSGCTANNIPLAEDTECFPEMGDFTDYKTGYHGKWHLGDEIFEQHGFEEWISIDDGYRPFYSEERDQDAHSTYYHFLKEKGFKPDVKKEDGFQMFSRGFCARLPEEYSKPAFLAGEADRFLKGNRDNPFILFVNFFEPHMPYFGPRDDMYNPENIPLPPNFNDESEDHPLKIKLLQEAYKEYGHSGLSLKTEEDWQKMIANYWGLVSQVDHYLGKILDSLEEYGLDDNTIIIYTSDHGDMMGSHRLLAKCVMYEEAVKAPLLLKIPGLEKKDVYVPVSQVDLVPTLLEAMRQPQPEYLQGYSWLPFLKDKAPLQEEDVFIEWNGSNNGIGSDKLGRVNKLDVWQDMATREEIEETMTDPIRTVITPEGWKFNYSQREEHELYNLKKDPYEMNNLMGEESPELINELIEKIQGWQGRTNDGIKIKKVND